MAVAAQLALQLALQIDVALIPQLVTSPQHLSKILDTPPVGVGAGAGTSVPAEAARRQ